MRRKVAPPLAVPPSPTVMGRRLHFGRKKVKQKLKKYFILREKKQNGS
jgi:hypothetical protein